MEELYFAVYGSEEGLHVDRLTKDELLARLSEQWWGPNVTFNWTSNTNRLHTDNIGEENVVIIKGCVIKPREKKTVVEYDIP